MGNGLLIGVKLAESGLYWNGFMHDTILIYHSLIEDGIKHYFYIFDNFSKMFYY